MKHYVDADDDNEDNNYDDKQFFSFARSFHVGYMRYRNYLANKVIVALYYS
jgi:hypothetical protein